MVSSNRRRAALRATCALALLVAACHEAPPEDPLRKALMKADPTAWVTVLDPERSSPGYTLTLFRRRIPMLIDRSGRIVHAWPDLRALGRARLTRDCDLYLIGMDDAIQAWSWDGEPRFRYELAAGEFPHHDLIQLANGSYLFPVRSDSTRSDALVEVDPSGREVWRWRLADHRDRFPGWDDEARDATHVNSVHEIGPNPAFDAGDARFRPGNLLVSARNLSTIFVVDPTSDAVVWQRSDGLDYQHEARLVPTGRVGAGQVVFFNNRYHERDPRGSRVEAFEPASDELVASYASPFFFSAVAGAVQPLPNGSFLISSSQGGRVFEVTRSGEIVWQLEPPTLPMRAHRYPPDHCPELARRAEGELRPVARSRPFLDQDVYEFVLSEEPLGPLAGVPKQALPVASACRKLRIPAGARLHLGYGFDPSRVGEAPVEARFVAELRELASGKRSTLLDERVVSEPGGELRERVVPVDAWPYERVELCLDARLEASEPAAGREAKPVWAVPRIVVREESVAAAPPTPEEERFREEQLRRIGYVQ